MNVITADFNWFSLLILVIAGVIGIVKSMNANKQGRQPAFELPDFGEEKDTLEEYINPEFEPRDYQQSNSNQSFDYDVTKNEVGIINEPLIMQTEDEEPATQPEFDIRQAIISSEILRRPEF